MSIYRKYLLWDSALLASAYLMGVTHEGKSFWTLVWCGTAFISMWVSHKYFKEIKNG